MRFALKLDHEKLVRTVMRRLDKEQLLELLEESLWAGDTHVVSAKKSLAISLVNGLVHCGNGQDKLMVSSAFESDEHIKAVDKWVAQNKDKG